MIELSGLTASEILVMGIRLMHQTKQNELKKIKEAKDQLYAPKNTKNVQ